jgi:hypothetical protein
MIIIFGLFIQQLTNPGVGTYSKLQFWKAGLESLISVWLILVSVTPITLKL